MEFKQLFIIPFLLTKQECYKEWNDFSFPITEQIHNEELSLPMSPVMTMDEIKEVVDLLNNWKY